MVVLTIGYWIFTIIGIIATIYTTVLCGIIIKKYVLDEKTWKKVEYQLILVRVVYDSLNMVINGLSTLLFELIPSLIFSNGIIDAKSLGPAMGVLRTLGRAVEATVMVKLMKKTSVIPAVKTEE